MPRPTRGSPAPSPRLPVPAVASPGPAATDSTSWGRSVICFPSHFPSGAGWLHERRGRIPTPRALLRSCKL